MVCKKVPATIKVSKLVKGQVHEEWLCPRCAARRSPYYKIISPQEPMSGGVFAIEALLQAVVPEGGEEAQRADVDERECPTCGLPLRTYRETLFLGCSDCYAAFEDVLERDLVRYHGAAVHTGRTPQGDAAAPEPQVAIKDLQRRLEVAVRREDFELAARLRDEIRRLREQIQSSCSSGGKKRS
jgi:protein arginine kinase activator